MAGVLWWVLTIAVLPTVAWLVLPQLLGLRRARAGDYAAAERWYGRALSPLARMSGQGNIAVAQFYAGELEAAEQRFRVVFDYARQHRHRRLERHTLINLGACLIAQRRLQEAAPLLAWVVRDRKARPEQRAAALYNLAWISYLEFDFGAAERSLAAARQEAPRGGGSLAVLYELMAGRLATRTGNWDLARRHLDDSAERARRFGRGLPGQVALSRGALEYLAGNREPGLEMVLTSAASLVAADRGDLAGRTMLGLAHIARTQGDQAAAAKLESAAARFRGIMPMPSPEDCAAYLRDSAAPD
ncbi:MAG: hypothetical protein E6I08_08715 [Chloroflexi bacterium]|nr:MAG: hypothetical protein E6I08_08715 [Chloroflexota bacterium]